jgi:hypothetical protein
VWYPISAFQVSAFQLLPPSPRHAARLREVRFHIAPFENHTPPNFVIRQESALHPVIHCPQCFVHSPGDFVFADEALWLRCLCRRRILVWISHIFSFELIHADTKICASFPKCEGLQSRT